MEEVKVYCVNTQAYEFVVMGTTLQQLCQKLKCTSVLAALVDNKLKSLDYKIINPHNVQFIGYDHPDGRRTYIRSLCFVLQYVIREMYPGKVLAIDYSLPSGLYCEGREVHSLEDGRPCVHFVTDEELEKIEARMRELIAADLPFGKTMLSREECCRIFEANHQTEKVDLFRSTGRFNYNVYSLDGQQDTFYGPLVPSTGMLNIFDITGFNEGFCLQYPMDGCPDRVLPMKRSFGKKKTTKAVITCKSPTRR